MRIDNVEHKVKDELFMTDGGDVPYDDALMILLVSMMGVVNYRGSDDGDNACRYAYDQRC